jgi:hypothetical protein
VVAAALDVVGTEIGDANETTRADNRLAAGRGIGSVRLRHLEEHPAERVVDVLVVLVLALREALQNRRLPDLLEQVGIAERRPSTRCAP